MTSIVINMRTGLELLYILSPEEAVLAAYQQYTLKNWHWWALKENTAPIEEGKWHWFCGDFAARKHEKTCCTPTCSREARRYGGKYCCSHCKNRGRHTKECDTHLVQHPSDREE